MLNRRWLGLIGWLILALICFLPLVGEAKKKRRAVSSPVKILNVVTAPYPFVIGQGPLTLSMVVQIPPSLKGVNVLEVSALITSSTRRSMSFVTTRVLLDEQELKGRGPTLPVELTWEGKDQHDEFVVDGSYFYEIQAKLMKDEGDGPRTKIVSRRVNGTLEALAYEGEVLPPVLPEQDLPEALEQAREEVLTGSDVSLEDEESTDSNELTGMEKKHDAESVNFSPAAGKAPLSDFQEGEPGGESHEPTSGESVQESTQGPIPELPATSEVTPFVFIEDATESSRDKKNPEQLGEETEKEFLPEKEQIRPQPTNEQVLEQTTVSGEAPSAR